MIGVVVKGIAASSGWSIHVARALVDHPQVATMSLTNPDLVKSFFIEKWSMKIFETMHLVLDERLIGKVPV
jgi:hypothetical protein